MRLLLQVSTLILFLLPACGRPLHQNQRYQQRAPTASGESNQIMPVIMEELSSELAFEQQEEAEMIANDKAAMEILNQSSKDRYLSARGVDLRLSRAELAPGAETAVARNFTALVDKLAVIFQKTPEAVGLQDASSFVIDRPLMNASPNYGSTAYRQLYLTLGKLCSDLISSQATRFQKPLSPDNLRLECQAWSEKFWYRPMLASEAMSCLQAGEEIARSTNEPAKAWSSVCQAIASAPQMLAVYTFPLMLTDPNSSQSPPTGTSSIVGSATTGRELFLQFCVGCHSGAKQPRAKTPEALRAALGNMNHIGRERFFQITTAATTATEAHHMLAYLKTLP